MTTQLITQATTKRSHTLRLLNWNVHGKTYQPQTEIGESLLRVAGGPDFDCVVLTEVPKSHTARLEIQECFERHGWTVITTPSTPESTFGITIASRRTAGGPPTLVASADTPHVNYLVVKATFGDQSVLIVGVRIKTAGADAEDYRTRAVGVESLRLQIAELQVDHPATLIIGGGDLNHGRIRGLERSYTDDEIDRLYDGLLQSPVAYERIANILKRQGLVLHTPASGHSIGGLKLDHVFAPQGVRLTTTYGQDYWGSDHRPQFATVYLAEYPGE